MDLGLGIPAEPRFRSVNNFNCRGFGPLLEDKLCLIFKLAPSVCRMPFPLLAPLLVRLVVLLPFQLLRLSLATPSISTPFVLSDFITCTVALHLTSLLDFLQFFFIFVAVMVILGVHIYRMFVLSHTSHL